VRFVLLRISVHFIYECLCIFYLLPLGKGKGKGKGKAVHGTPSQLRCVTCHMGSHNVTFHPTQVSILRLHPSQSYRLVLDLPTQEGWKAELT